MEQKINIRLAEVILQSGKTQKQIAKLVGVGQSVISQYTSRKKMPSLYTFALICKVLDVSSDYILGLETQTYTLKA